MYSWVVHFLSYFISISERDIGTQRQEAEGGGKVKSFYLFIYKRKHSEQKKLVCKACGESFRWVKQRRRHLSNNKCPAQ